MKYGPLPARVSMVEIAPSVFECCVTDLPSWYTNGKWAIDTDRLDHAPVVQKRLRNHTEGKRRLGANPVPFATSIIPRLGLTHPAATILGTWGADYHGGSTYAWVLGHPDERKPAAFNPMLLRALKLARPDTYRWSSIHGRFAVVAWADGKPVGFAMGINIPDEFPRPQP